MTDPVGDHEISTDGHGTSQVLKEAIKAVGPQTNNDIVFLRYVFQRRRNAGCQRYCQKVGH